MKIKKIRWYQPLTDNYKSKCGSIRLQCRKLYGMYNYTRYPSVWEHFASPKWQCSISIGNVISRSGPFRNSADTAKADANNLIIQLLRDIRDGTQQIMDEFKIGEDN